MIYSVGSSTSRLHRTYLVSRPIIAWYYTGLVGDARRPPTLLASPGFEGLAVIGWPPNETCSVSVDL